MDIRVTKTELQGCVVLYHLCLLDFVIGCLLSRAKHIFEIALSYETK